MTRRKRILVVEDERDLAEILAYNLQKSGYQITVAFDGRQALDRVSIELPDLILLDVMIPEMSGIEVAGRLRASPATAGIPVIMLTARGEEVDQIVGLSVGADDYITKPFSMKVLLARIEAVLRRAERGGSAAASTLSSGPVSVNLETHEVRCAGREVSLTLTEFRLLSAILGAGGRVMTRAALMSKAIGPGITVTDRTIDVHVMAIRRKLGEHGAIIRTVRGVGYKLDPRGESEREEARE
jgi:two-component system phosphate regulon response regulator PhoB